MVLQKISNDWISKCNPETVSIDVVFMNKFKKIKIHKDFSRLNHISNDQPYGQALILDANGQALHAWPFFVLMLDHLQKCLTIAMVKQFPSTQVGTPEFKIYAVKEHSIEINVRDVASWKEYDMWIFLP